MPHWNSSTQSQRPDSECIFRIALSSTLHSEQIAQYMAGYPRAAWRRRLNRCVQAAAFHPTGWLYMKPQPSHHKDFGCVRFLVSDQGALPAPYQAHQQNISSAGKWVRLAVGPRCISGSWERPGERPGRSHQASASHSPLQHC